MESQCLKDESAETRGNEWRVVFLEVGVNVKSEKNERKERERR